MAKNYREPEIIFDGWSAPKGTRGILTREAMDGGIGGFGVVHAL